MNKRIRDFRTTRAKLPPEAFAIHPAGPEPPARDVVDKEVWQSIMALPDDVALRTSDDYGTEIRAMWELWGSLIDMSTETEDAWFRTCLYMADGLQSCTFNALCGYYGIAASALRGTMEALIAGVFFQLIETVQAAVQWQDGKYDLRFGLACDRLMTEKTIMALETQLIAQTGQAIFQQKSIDKDPGWARRLYSELSNFSHSRPTHSEGSMWEGSNGPIFVPQSFGRVVAHYIDVCALLYVLVKVCRPNMQLPKESKWLFALEHVMPSQIGAEAFRNVWGTLPSRNN
jgi:hypothetical protein